MAMTYSISFAVSVCHRGDEFFGYCTAILLSGKGRHFELIVITFIEKPPVTTCSTGVSIRPLFSSRVRRIFLLHSTNRKTKGIVNWCCDWLAWILCSPSKRRVESFENDTGGTTPPQAQAIFVVGGPRSLREPSTLSPQLQRASTVEEGMSTNALAC